MLPVNGATGVTVNFPAPFSCAEKPVPLSRRAMASTGS